MKNLSVSEQLTHTTVRIECDLANGASSSGTGFFFRFMDSAESHYPAIVTNKHVVNGALRGRFHITPTTPAGDPDHARHRRIEIEDFAQKWIDHPDPQIDLCIMPIAPLLSNTKGEADFFYLGLDKSLLLTAAELDELSAVEDVIMIGYPSGIWDATNNMPIVRKGITATHLNLRYEGRDEFLIDAACFPGSSGSPVFLYNAGGYTTRSGNMMLGSVRAKLLGVLYAGPTVTAEGVVRIVEIPTGAQAVSVSRIQINLGMVIRAERLLDFDTLLETLLPPGPLLPGTVVTFILPRR